MISTGRCLGTLGMLFRTHSKLLNVTGMIMENKNKPKLMWKCLKQLLPGKSKPNLKGQLVMVKLLLTQRALQMPTMNILPPLVMT